MDREEILQTLRRDVEAAKEELASVIEELDAIVRESPGALQPPDGGRHSQSAAEALSVARRAVEAFGRLNAFGAEGIDNLKKTAGREEGRSKVRKTSSCQN
jgi:hypothetical protein